MLTPKPFLLSEIIKAKKISNEISEVSGHQISSAYFYGFVKRKFEGERHPDGGWTRPPSIVITDEEAEEDLFIRPKPWEESDIQIVQSCYNNDMVIVKGVFNWYPKEGKDVFNVNVENISIVSQDNLDNHRKFFLSKLARTRLGESFKTDTYFHNFLNSKGVPLREGEDSFTINTPTEEEPVSIIIKKKEKKTTTSKPKAKKEKTTKKPTPQKKVEKKSPPKTDTKPKKSSASPKKNVKKSKSEKDDVSVEDLEKLLKEKKKISITEIKEKFGIDDAVSWNLALQLKRTNKLIEVENDQTTKETYLVMK